ncbi:MAG TPA: hypothetical protein VGI39_01490 [Polyangiaceae bacterium]|jgi:hypothetical protein
MRALFPVAFLLAACAACPRPAPGEEPSAPPFADAPVVCENLARVGCAIGKDRDCADVMRQAVSENLTTRAALACAETAHTATEVVACDRSFLSCP